MSAGGLEIVRRYVSSVLGLASEHRDDPHPYAPIDAAMLNPSVRQSLAYVHPSIRWRNAQGEVYDGKLACFNGYLDLLRSGSFYSLALDDVTDLGGDRVLAQYRVEMTGVQSGAATAMTLFAVIALRDGLITEMSEYATRDEALTAAQRLALNGGRRVGGQCGGGQRGVYLARSEPQCRRLHTGPRGQMSPRFRFAP